MGAAGGWAGALLGQSDVRFQPLHPAAGGRAAAGQAGQRADRRRDICGGWVAGVCGGWDCLVLPQSVGPAHSVDFRGDGFCSGGDPWKTNPDGRCIQNWVRKSKM